tara:strand:- start:243 stop:1274 length:1032 start_codon:yes stop_codon:yes gene_type:complete
MPCYECENGKYKFGQTGECRYDTKSECDDANKDYYAQETYDDYPKAASENAARALKWLEENDNPNDCLTPVGFARANQLKNREKLSRDTIARMASFKRHQQHKDVPYEEGCGGIAYDCWGGEEGIEWAIRKLEQIDNEEKEMKAQEETEVSERIKKALQNKMEKHNEDVKDLKKDWNPKVTVAKLEKVFKRGVGAYYTNPESVREGVSSPDQWALARCNSYLFALRNGRYRSGKHDTDLLPENHPMKTTKEEKNMAKKRKYYGDEEHDFHLEITEEMMAELHTTGELEVMVSEGEKRMLIKFTYGGKEEKEEKEETEEMTVEEVKDEFENFFKQVITNIKSTK